MKFDSSDLIVCHDLTSALAILEQPIYRDTIESVYVIGGGNVYKEAMQLPECESIYLTIIYKQVECDAFFPAIPQEVFVLDDSCSDKQEENGVAFEFRTYRRRC